MSTIADLVCNLPDLPRAACKGGAASTWDDYLDAREDSDDRAMRLRNAITICRTCPEQDGCLAARNTDPDRPGGVWGGQLFVRGRPDPVRPPVPPRDSTPPRKHRKTSSRTALCLGCDQPYQPSSRRQLYCNRQCKERHRWAVKRAGGVAA